MLTVAKNLSPVYVASAIAKTANVLFANSVSSVITRRTTALISRSVLQMPLVRMVATFALDARSPAITGLHTVHHSPGIFLSGGFMASLFGMCMR